MDLKQNISFSRLFEVLAFQMAIEVRARHSGVLFPIPLMGLAEANLF